MTMNAYRFQFIIVYACYIKIIVYTTYIKCVYYMRTHLWIKRIELIKWIDDHEITLPIGRIQKLSLTILG